MKIPFQPLPDGEPKLDVPQFLFRLKHDPGFAPLMQRHYEAALALPAGPDTEDMQRSAKAALKTLKHHQGAWHAMQALKRCVDLKEQPGLSREELLTQMAALASEAIDHLLDVDEPERSRLMARTTAIQDAIREMQAAP